MKSSNVLDEIVDLLKKAVATSLSISQEALTVEISEFTKQGKDYNIVGTFNYAPFLTSRSGSVFATLTLISEDKLEIASLKIEEEEL